MASRFLLNVVIAAAAFVAGIGVGHWEREGAGDPGDRPTALVKDDPDAGAAAGGEDTGAAQSHTPAEIAQRFEAALADGNYYRQSKALALLVRELRPEDIQPALAAMGEGAAWKRQWFKATIVARWADFDPAAAAEYALEKFVAAERHTNPAIAASFAKWAERDEAAARRRAESIEDSTQQCRAVRGMMATLMQRAPQAALAWAQTLPSPVRDRDFYRTTYESWARKDAPAATQGAVGIADAENRKMALSGAASQWVQSAPQAAADWAAGLTDTAQRASALNAVFGRWGMLDPEAAAAAAQPLVPRDAQAPDFYYSIIGEMTERNARRALDFARASADGPESLRRWAGAIAGAAYHDPVTALADVKQLPPGESQSQTFSEILRYIGTVDSSRDAVEFAICGLQKGKDRDNVLPFALEMLISSDGAAGMDSLVGRTDLTPDNLKHAFGAFARWHPDAAMQWAQTQPEGPEKKAYLEGMMDIHARRSPEAAVGLLAQCPLAARASMIGEIASTWSGSDPARTAAWARQLPDAGERAVAWEKLTENWSATHPVEAATWLKTLPPGTDRDAAAAAYARTVMGIDPDAALAWAVSIGDGAKRDEALRNAYRHWREFDPEAAGAWLGATSDLAEEARVSLQKEAPR